MDSIPDFQLNNSFSEDKNNKEKYKSSHTSFSGLKFNRGQCEHAKKIVSLLDHRLRPDLALHMKLHLQECMFCQKKMNVMMTSFKKMAQLIPFNELDSTGKEDIHRELKEVVNIIFVNKQKGMVRNLEFGQRLKVKFNALKKYLLTDITKSKLKTILMVYTLVLLVMYGVYFLLNN